jgi:FkbM family methyltransferase
MSGPVIHFARHGALLHHVDDRVIGAALAAYGEWAEEEIYLLRPAAPLGAVVLDIGANVGTHTLAFSRFVGPEGIVLSFDGQRAAFRLLSASMLLNRCANVRCVAALIGRENMLDFGGDQIPAARENLGSMCFREPQTVDHSLTPCFPVPTSTVDSLRLRRCDLLKIDVEGMEVDVLHGAIRTLRRHKPVVYFEQAGPARLPEAVALLTGLGYVLRWHHAHPYNGANFRGERSNIFGTARESNILAVHPSGPAPAELFGLDRMEAVDDCNFGQPSEDGGWSLPDGAYGDLPNAWTHGVSSFDDVLPGTAGWGTSSHIPQGGYAAAYAALEIDRGKAQEIMEYLSKRVADLEGRLAVSDAVDAV